MLKTMFLKRAIPSFFIICTLTGCSNTYNSESAAINACEEWAAEAGNFEIDLTLPDTTVAFISTLAKRKYKKNYGDANMAFGVAFAEENPPIRFCINKARASRGNNVKFVISGIENKNFKKDQIVSLDASEFGKYVGGQLMLKQKDMNKFADKVYQLMQKRTDYKPTKQFKF